VNTLHKGQNVMMMMMMMMIINMVVVVMIYSYNTELSANVMVIQAVTFMFRTKESDLPKH
jgi:hypothetical protein